MREYYCDISLTCAFAAVIIVITKGGGHMKIVNWAIIGTGRIAHTFAEALQGTEGARLYAVGSRTLSKAQAFADEFGFEKAYGSYDELVRDSRIDVVYIATPMASHYKDTMLCLDNGLNILCEKSAALSLSELDEMLAKAADKGLFFMEAMWMKCRPVYLKALDWVRTGRIGTPQFLKADFNSLVKYDRSDRLFAPECGGGALLDLSVYPLTFALDFLGAQPEDITTYAHIGKDGVDLSNTILLKYETAYADISAGFEVPAINRAVISGDKGSIVFADWFFCCCEVSLYDSETNLVEKSEIPNEVNGYEYEIREVHRCLEHGLIESSLVPHSSTRAVMKIMDECRTRWGMKFPGEN